MEIMSLKIVLGLRNQPKAKIKDQEIQYLKEILRGNSLKAQFTKQIQKTINRPKG